MSFKRYEDMTSAEVDAEIARLCRLSQRYAVVSAVLAVMALVSLGAQVALA